MQVNLAQILLGYTQILCKFILQIWNVLIQSKWAVLHNLYRYFLCIDQVVFYILILGS